MAVTEELIEGDIIVGDSGEEVPSDGVLGLLQQAARTVDGMWRSAQTDGRHSAAVALGEASYGIHRALIALQVEGLEVETPAN